MPDPEFRIIRLHTRYRRDLTDERTREKNRAEKLLESAAIKLSSVVTDLHGVTGRDIMDHLIAGEHNPKVLAQLARARARRKITELEHALDGAEFFTAEHAALLKAMLERIDRLTAEIGKLSEVIDGCWPRGRSSCRRPNPCPAGAAAPPRTLSPRPGRHGQVPHRRPPVLLGREAPLDHQSGKRAGRAQHKKGNKYLAAVTGETAITAGKTATREGARYRKLARSRGKAKAQVALGNTQLKVYHKLLSNPGMRYQTSARTTTNGRPPPAARSPTTSARSKPSASKSPSPAYPIPTRTDQQAPRPPDPSACLRRRHKPPRAAAARPAEVLFSG